MSVARIVVLRLVALECCREPMGRRRRLSWQAVPDAGLDGEAPTADPGDLASKFAGRQGDDCRRPAHGGLEWAAAQRALRPCLFVMNVRNRLPEWQVLTGRRRLRPAV